MDLEIKSIIPFTMTQKKTLSGLFCTENMYRNFKLKTTKH